MSAGDDKARRKQLREQYLREQQAMSAAAMPIDRAQLESLLEHVDAAVQARGCDHTRTATDEWAERAGVDLASLHRGLEEHGGFCDCEVVMNVHPDDVWRPRYR